SSAMTTSCSSLRYIVKSLPPSAAIAEKPSPKSRCHKRRGPVEGQVAAKPVAGDLKLRCGPPHCGHAGDCANAVSPSQSNNTGSNQAAQGRPMMSPEYRRVRRFSLRFISPPLLPLLRFFKERVVNRAVNDNCFDGRRLIFPWPSVEHGGDHEG